MGLAFFMFLAFTTEIMYCASVSIAEIHLKSVRDKRCHCSVCLLEAV